MFPPLHIMAFLHVLHTGLCSSPWDWHTTRPKYTHTMLLVFFFLTKVAGNSAISLRTKNSTLHVASCLVSCRVASLIFSSVSVRYTSKTIYHDRENACNMIIDYPKYLDYIVTPVYWSVCVCVCVCLCVCVCVCVCVCDGDAEATRLLEKTAISGEFMWKLRIFCRWKELYAYEAHVEPAIQFPVGGRCHICCGFKPSTINPSNSFASLDLHSSVPPYHHTPWGLLSWQSDRSTLTASSGYGDRSTWRASTACFMAMAASCHSPQGFWAWA